MTTTIDKKLIEERLRAVFVELQDSDSPGFRERQDDFVFHMLDWKDDLEQLAALYSRPEHFSPEEVHKIVQAFMYHASSHIVAAARLADQFLDSFGSEPSGKHE
jgi:hypothetical protein